MAEFAASTCLTLREIENELSEVSGEDWYPLGVQLRLRPATLREIQRNYPLDTERCRKEMLDLWLRSAPKVSWRTLAQAVQGLGRYTSLAHKLRRKIPPAPKAPSAPTIVSVEATSSTSISVEWNGSKKDRGSPITGYVVEYHAASDPSSSFETQVVARDVFSTTLDDLALSTEYDVWVRGENAVCCSVPSTTMRTKTDEQVEDKVESVRDSEEDQLSSTGDSEGNESSSAGTKTDGEVEQSVNTVEDSEEDKLSVGDSEEGESSSTEGSEEEETDPRVQEEKLLKTLRESIKEYNLNSFCRHLDELGRIVQNNEQMKVLLQHDGTLCLAAHVGSNSVVETLIQKGVDINTMSRVPEHPVLQYTYMSPLHWAANRSCVDTVKYLIEEGAKVNSKDDAEWTPLHRAALKGHTDTVECLIKKGAEVNIEDNDGDTPLHLAVLNGHTDTVQYLTEKGADINIKDNDGRTPLHWAAGDGDVDAVRYLVGAGGDINIKDIRGMTPLDWATAWGHEAVMSYFKRAADPNMLEENESTGRQQEQRQSPEETNNSSSEEPPALAVKEEETEESDDEDIDSQLKILFEKYRHQPTIKHKSLKCLFTGPPRVGKTTLKKRLLKTIKNLILSGVVNPSGGLEKPISVVIGETRECVTVVMESDIDWKPQHELLDEAQMLLEFIDKSYHPSSPTPDPTPVPLKPVPSTPVPAPVMPAPSAPVATREVSSKSVPDLPTPREGEADTLDDAKKLMREVLSSRKLCSIKDIEKTTTLYFMDTGGQPEFHEIMPLILNGPALHLVFFNLTFDLDDPIPIRFCHQDGNDSTITYVSSYTGKQMIFQLLSSLYYFSKSLSPDSEPAAVLIGTHLDQLRGQDEMKINDALNLLLNNVEFHDQGLLTYPTRDKSTIFIPVNNYSGDEEEIHKLQAFLKQVIDNRFSPVELPSSWLFFHLLLRHRYENSPGVCTLADCRALAKGCGLDEKDVPQVLRYIHRHLGTILFYEEVQGLNELVICDPNVLFESIYHLVAVSFGGSRDHHTSAAEVRKTGEIPNKVLERISSQPSSSLLTNEHIIELLKHFKILTEFHSDEKIVYFMPCILQPNNSPDLHCKAQQTLCPPPLLVRFDGNYIPIGVFSALVVKLSQSSWEPDRQTRYRNHILFHTDGVFPVELIVHPAYLDFRIRIANYEEEEPKEIHEFCMDVCKTVVSSLKSILGLHEHTKKTKFQLGFYCPGSFQDDGHPHFCGCLPRLNYSNPKSFVCSKSPRCQDQCRLPPECTIWFDCWKSKATSRKQNHACNSGCTSRTGATSTQPELKEIQNELGEVTEWHQLGLQLGVPHAKLKEIENDYPQNQRRKVEVLDWWCRNTAEVSWIKLTKAVEEMGYTVLAERLRRKTFQGVQEQKQRE